MTAPNGARRSMAEVTDSVGLSRRHWVYFALIALILLADGMDVTLVSHTFPSLIKEWGVSIGGGITVVVTGGFIAMGIGATIAGRLADLWGRKSLLVAAGLLFSAATALGATSDSFTTFTVWRFVASLGLGAVMPTGLTLIADLIPAKRRSSMLAAGYVGVTLGQVVGAILAGVLIPTGGWRSLLVAGGVVPLVLTLVLAVVVPESPAFHAARGSIDKARRALARVAPSVDPATVDLTPPVRDRSEKEALRVILSKRFAVTTALLWVFGFFSLGTQLLLGQYLPTLLQQPDPGLNTVQSSTIIGVMGLAGVLGGLTLSLILTKVSRFVIIGINLGLSAVVALAVGLIPNPGFAVLLPVLAIAGFILPTGFGPTRNVLAAAAYPLKVRGTGVGTTELSGRVGSAAGGVVGGTLIGAGLTLSGMFLLLLVPIGVLLGTLVGLKADAKRTGTASLTGFQEEQLVPVAPAAIDPAR